MAIKQLAILAMCGLLAACGTDGQSDDALGVAGQAIASVFNRGEPRQLTATRASLDAGGFDQSLLVATLRQPTFIRAGLLVAAERQGIVFWRGNDGGTVKTDGGIVRGTVGAGYDLYSVDTQRTRAAVMSGASRVYPRTYRHLNSLNQLTVTRVFCEMTAPQPETITVFDRIHQTLRFVERCQADTAGPTGEPLTVENVFWKDRNRSILWRSDQWISPEIGNILFERVYE